MLRVNKEVDESQKEEDERTVLEKARSKALHDSLMKTYNNNVKLWSLIAFTDKELHIDRQ